MKLCAAELARYNLRAMMADGTLRREIIVGTIIAIQSREGITTTREQAEAAYDHIQNERPETRDEVSQD